MILHIIMHESFESPGVIETRAKNKGYKIFYTRLYAGESFPKNIEEFDLLIIMGGPQSPSTSQYDCPYFNASQEIAFIKSVIKAGKLVLGICLGAQLIGEALGASYDHSPYKEIGSFPIYLTAEGTKHSFFGSLPKEFLVGHRHGDMPGLTNDCTIIAYSEGCPRQIIEYSPKVYGFQCHFEFNTASIIGMIEHSRDELDQYSQSLYVQDAEILKSMVCKPFNSYLFSFLDYFEKQ